VGRLKVVDAQGQPQLLVVLGEFDAIFGEKRAGRSSRSLSSPVSHSFW